MTRGNDLNGECYTGGVAVSTSHVPDTTGEARMSGTDEPRQQASLFGGMAPAPPTRQPRRPAQPESALDDAGGPDTTQAPAHSRPLAARMRPQTLDEILGQPHLLD